MIREAVDRIARNAIDAFKSALGIESPSQVWRDAFREAQRRQYEPPTPPPWYAARSPLDPWESKAKRRSARLTRRAIRRGADPWAWLDPVKIASPAALDAWPTEDGH